MVRKRISTIVRAAIVTTVAIGAGLFAVQAPAFAEVTSCGDPRGAVELDWAWYQEDSAYICFVNNVSSFVGTYFPQNGVGGGERVWANAFSGCNHDPYYYALIWSGTGYTGFHDTLLRGLDGEGSCHPFVNEVRNRNYSLSWSASY